MTQRHYLDYASTAPLRPVARQAIIQALSVAAGDPGRLHEEALTVRHLLELARQSVATFVGARPREVIFTSSATESIAATIWGIAESQPDGTILATAVEHSAVRLAAERSGRSETIGVNNAGLVDPDEVGRRIDKVRRQGSDVSLLACQWVNHEVGTVQPIKDVIAVAKERDVAVLIDAAQAVGRLPLDFNQLGADFVVFSGHKLGGPVGVGVTLTRRGIRIPPLLIGGAQERARRAGVENTPAAVGVGAACAELHTTASAEKDRAIAFTTELRQILLGVEGITIFGSKEPTFQAPHLVSAGIADIEPQAILLGLDRNGIAAHSGSACAAEDITPSPVLEAMGVDSERSLRLSVGWQTTSEDTAALASCLPSVIAEMRSLRT